MAQPKRQLDPGITRSTLLEGMRLRDEAAWQRVVELYGPLIYSWCRRSNCSKSDAQDLVQEVFWAVAQHIDRLRRESGDSFRAWLRTITRNKIIDQHRRQQGILPAAGGTAANQQIHAVAESLDDSNADAEKRDKAELLSRALQMVKTDFEESTWQAFWLSTVEGDATASIAAKLDMKPNAVRQARYRVVRRLRDEFGDLLD
ncbi:MAG: sigma-70 family RNA polymerase sigma factor [Planctomycetaceae bacterium]|nr:sigma-70 family RNA polymerase sigma factor [Planctomycetaceae bacterium]